MDLKPRAKCGDVCNKVPKHFISTPVTSKLIVEGKIALHGHPNNTDIKL